MKYLAIWLHFHLYNLNKHTMTKTSILQDWVSNLTIMQQGALLTSIRGPDGISKVAPVKIIVKLLRGTLLKPANLGYSGRFISSDYNEFESADDEFFQDMDFYPLHFVTHLFHSAEILGYKYPDPIIRDIWHKFYLKACDSLHMPPESEKAMDERLI